MRRQMDAPTPASRSIPARMAITSIATGVDCEGAPSGGAGRLEGGTGGIGAGVTSVRERVLVSARWAASPDPTRLLVIASFTASANAEYDGAVAVWRRAKTSAPRRSSMEYPLSIRPSLKSVSYTHLTLPTILRV